VKKIFLSAAVIFLAACSAKLVTPMQEDADRVKPKYPDITLTELTEGKALFEQYCGTCHGYKKPRSRSEEEWKNIVPKMVRKVNKKQPDAIDSAEQKKILKYVITMKDAPKRR